MMIDKIYVCNYGLWDFFFLTATLHIRDHYLSLRLDPQLKTMTDRDHTDTVKHLSGHEQHFTLISWLRDVRQSAFVLPTL